MEYPSVQRASLTKEEQPEFCEERESLEKYVQNFACTFWALAFVRAKNNGCKFQINSNAKCLGAFHDVAVEYLDATARKSHIFLQLKSKATKHITIKQLLAEKGDFSLFKFYESYIEIEEKFNCSEGDKINSFVDENLFVIHTNADVGQELKSSKVAEVGEGEFLMTGGSVLQFNEEEHKVVYEHLQELPKHREFLSRFRIFYCQADEKEMDRHIKSELQKSMKLSDSKVELAYTYFRDFMKDWSHNSNFFLKDTNCKENDPLKKTSEKVRTTLIAKVLDQRKCELDKLSIKYEDSEITDTEQQIEPHQALLIFAPAQSTTFTAAKIHQILSATEHIMLNLEQLVRYKSEVMLAWKQSFDVMVVEGGSSTEDFQDFFSEISAILKERVEKKFIFISSAMGNTEQIHALRSAFSTLLTIKYDDWKFTDIVTESRMNFLDKELYFQGDKIRIKDIVKESDIRMLNTLDCDSMSVLLGDEKPTIGIPIENTVEHHIERTLKCRKHVNSSSHGEENLQSGNTPAWRPSTLLDGEDQIVLITYKPGMGKSPFLSHLAKKTRERHPGTWIVIVNINNYTRILEEMKTNGSVEKGTIKMLTDAAFLKESDSFNLERHLFRYTYSSTGNMVVVIDGVDEVSPNYTEEVIKVLELLSVTKTKKIWVTSRNSMEGRLEQRLQCQSYSLLPFNDEDQKTFQSDTAAELVDVVATHCVPRMADETIARKAETRIQGIKQDMEKKDVTIDVSEERPPFQQRTLEEYPAVQCLFANIMVSQNIIRDHIIESGFNGVRNMMHKILAAKYPEVYLQVINSIVESQKAVQREAEVNSTANLERNRMKGNILDVGDIDGKAALHLAAAAGSTNIASYLVSAGSDLNAGNTQGEYALTLAARAGVNDVVELLPKCDKDIKYDEAKFSALRAATLGGHVDRAALLLKSGAPVNKGETEQPIHTTSRLGHKGIVSLLLQHGPSLDIANKEVWTLLHAAASCGHVDVRQMLKNGASVNIANKQVWASLYTAAQDVVRELLKYGSSVDYSNNGWTALYTAGQNGHLDLALELKHGAVVRLRSCRLDSYSYRSCRRPRGGCSRVSELRS